MNISNHDSISRDLNAVHQRQECVHAADAVVNGSMILSLDGELLQSDRYIHELLSRYGYAEAATIIRAELHAYIEQLKASIPKAGAEMHESLRCDGVFSFLAPEDNCWSLRPMYAQSGALQGFVLFSLRPEVSCDEHELDLFQLRTLVDSITEPILVTDGKHRILLINEMARRMLGTCRNITRSGVLLPFLECSYSEEVLPAYLDIVMNTGETLCFSREITNAKHRSSVYEFVYAPLTSNNDGAVVGVIERARDITRKTLMKNLLDEQEERVQQLIHYDSLTNLPSRSLFSQRLGNSIETAVARGNDLAVICLDLDNFKKVNDSLGHDVGDMLLCQVAERLSNCVGVRDTIARLSGDDFFILLDNLLDTEHAQVVAQNILWALRKSFSVAGYELYLSGSAGIALFPRDATDARGMMRCADVAMNKSKRRGGNNLHFFTAELDRNIHEYLVLEADLQVAMAQRQLAVQYQPQYNIHSGEIVGVEALMRWYHPERGFISPGEFIPIAEESDIILDIGAWVLEEACWQNVAWQNQGLGAFCVAVNVSPRQFRHEGTLSQIQDVLTRTGMDPGLLELEITEGMIMDDVASATEMMRSLRNMGVKLAVDDFGTGYSSLSYLRTFNISKLKIDKSFVETIEQEEGAAQIAHSIVDLAKNLHLGVIAEGVETKAQLEFLRMIGCDEAQGYLLSRPVYAHEIPGCIANSGVMHHLSQ